MALPKLRRYALMTANPFSKNFIFLLLLSFIGVIFLPVAKGQAFKRVNEGESCIDFTANDTNGNKVNLKDFVSRNKVVGMVFWSSSSPRSIKELALLQDLYSKYKNLGLNFIAIYSPKSDKEITDGELLEITNMVAELNISFPILMDEGLKIYNQYGVITIPSLAFIDTNCKVLSILPGYPEFGGDKLVKRGLENILGIEIIAKPKLEAGYKPKDKALSYYNFAYKMFKMGFMGKAETKLDSAVKEDTSFALAHSLLGRVYARQGKLDKSTEFFISALELDPANVETHYYYGIVCRDSNRIAESISEFNKALAVSPKDPSIHYGLGTAYLKNGQKEQAKEKFIEAIRLFEESKDIRTVWGEDINPDKGDVYYDLANMYLEEKKVDESISALKKANSNYKEMVKTLGKSF